MTKSRKTAADLLREKESKINYYRSKIEELEAEVESFFQKERCDMCEGEGVHTCQKCGGYGLIENTEEHKKCVDLARLHIGTNKKLEEELNGRTDGLLTKDICVPLRNYNVELCVGCMEPIDAMCTLCDPVGEVICSQCSGSGFIDKDK